LRQLDLNTRLLKYPCSHLIYSEAFDAVPPELKRHLYHRLFAILKGEDQSPQFQRRDPQTRRAILEILTETKPGLPAYWNLE